MNKLIITGFGPFDDVSANPSEHLIRKLEQDGEFEATYIILNVAVDDVERFYSSLEPNK